MQIPKSLVYVFCLIAAIACDAQGAAPCSSVPCGVNRPGLAWVSSITMGRTAAAISDSGITSVRLSLVSPVDLSLDAINVARNHKLSVLQVLPLTDQHFYAGTSQPRSGQDRLWDARRLSDLDIEAFKAIWRRALQHIVSSSTKLNGVEIGNEFNSADFNGDLPVLEGGAILNFKNHHEFAFWPQYVEGMKKLVEVLRIVKLSLSESPAYKEVPVVLGGLARPQDTWNRNVGNVLVEPDLALKALIDLGAERYVDAYAIHLYPQVPKKEWTAPQPAIAAYIEERMAQVIAVAGTAKKWWITEWGFAKRADVKPGADGADPRLPLFRAFRDALATSRYASLIGPTYIYDWDESGNFSIWDGRRVLGTDEFFTPPENGRGAADGSRGGPR